MILIELEPTATPEQIKFKLVRLLDELMMLSSQTAWEKLASTELKSQHLKAVNALDTVWWQWRNEIGSSVD